MHYTIMVIPHVLELLSHVRQFDEVSMHYRVEVLVCDS